MPNLTHGSMAITKMMVLTSKDITGRRQIVLTTITGVRPNREILIPKTMEAEQKTTVQMLIIMVLDKLFIPDHVAGNTISIVREIKYMFLKGVGKFVFKIYKIINEIFF